jgi:hypothetical protein
MKLEALHHITMITAGIEGARAYSMFAPVEESVLTDTLGFTYLGEAATA